MIARADGRIAFVNGVAERLSGWTRAELLDRPALGRQDARRASALERPRGGGEGGRGGEGDPASGGGEAARVRTPPCLVVIVNADDLAYDPAIDRGILEAHRRGIVTSATAMVDTPFAERALAEAPASLDLGLHVVVPPGVDGAALRSELERQLARFERLRGEPPTHLDSHRHAHAAHAALTAFAEVARMARLPLRALDAAMRDRLRAEGLATVDLFLGDAALRPCWTADRLAAAIRALPPAGVVEIMAHPGFAPTHARTSFGAEREIELAAVCAEGVRQAVRERGATLGSFRSFQAMR